MPWSVTRERARSGVRTTRFSASSHRLVSHRFVVSAKEDRHLFDLYDQRETNNRLGAIQVEIKPCDDDVDIAACGCLGAPGDPTFLCQDEPEELMPPPKG